VDIPLPCCKVEPCKPPPIGSSSANRNQFLSDTQIKVMVERQIHRDHEEKKTLVSAENISLKVVMDVGSIIGFFYQEVLQPLQ
jgi:hypothetical protein